MVFISLFVSASVNLIIAVSSDFSIMKWLWLVNGFVLSVLWPTLIRLLSEALPQKLLGTSSVVMGTTVATGTLVIYGLSSIFVAFDKFKLSFYTAGIAVLVVGVIWVILYDKALLSAIKESEQEDVVEDTIEDIVMQKKQEKEESFFLHQYMYCVIVLLE